MGHNTSTSRPTGPPGYLICKIGTSKLASLGLLVSQRALCKLSRSRGGRQALLVWSQVGSRWHLGAGAVCKERCRPLFPGSMQTLGSTFWRICFLGGVFFLPEKGLAEQVLGDSVPPSPQNLPGMGVGGVGRTQGAVAETAERWCGRSEAESMPPEGLA